MSSVTPQSYFQKMVIRLDPRLAGLLSYLGIAGVLFLWLEKKHHQVRFHASQSLLVCIVLGIVNMGLSIVNSAVYRIGWELGVVLESVLWWIYPLEFVFWLFLLYQGYSLKTFELPWIGPVATRMARRAVNPGGSRGSVTDPE